MCVCVCVLEREREREYVAGMQMTFTFHLLPRFLLIKHEYGLICVPSVGIIDT